MDSRPHSSPPTPHTPYSSLFTLVLVLVLAMNVLAGNAAVRLHMKCPVINISQNFVELLQLCGELLTMCVCVCVLRAAHV